MFLDASGNTSVEMASVSVAEGVLRPAAPGRDTRRGQRAAPGHRRCNWGYHLRDVGEP